MSRSTFETLIHTHGGFKQIYMYVCFLRHGVSKIFSRYIKSGRDDLNKQI